MKILNLLLIFILFPLSSADASNSFPDAIMRNNSVCGSQLMPIARYAVIARFPKDRSFIEISFEALDAPPFCGQSLGSLRFHLKVDNLQKEFGHYLGKSLDGRLSARAAIIFTAAPDSNGYWDLNPMHIWIEGDTPEMHLELISHVQEGWWNGPCGAGCL